MPESPNKLLNNDHGNYVFATFTGHIYDTTLDIYFAEARFYDANNRTWLAMDPIKDGLNWYQYCYSNPTTYWDLYSQGIERIISQYIASGKTAKEFMLKVYYISVELNTEPDYLMAIMAFESWFNPKAKNSTSSAAGLIQLLESSANEVGTTTSDLANMSGIEQLDYVYRYFEPYKGNLNSLSDVYMVVLCKRAVGKPDDYEVYKKGTSSYERNKGLDLDNDGVITKLEATMTVEARRKLYEI